MNSQNNTDCNQFETYSSRRSFLSRSGMGLGAMALGKLMADDLQPSSFKGIMDAPHHTPKAKRVIYLFMRFKIQLMGL